MADSERNLKELLIKESKKKELSIKVVIRPDAQLLAKDNIKIM